MEQRLGRGKYAAAQTIILKIPIVLPYQLHVKGYQQAEGTFAHNGKFYHLIKQKIERDTLFVVCLKDLYKTALYSRMTDFEKAVNSWPLASGKSSNLLQIFIKDYLFGDPTTIAASTGWAKDFSFLETIFKVIERNYSPIPPPPKVVA